MSLVYRPGSTLVSSGLSLCIHGNRRDKTKGVHRVNDHGTRSTDTLNSPMKTEKFVKREHTQG